MNALRSTDRSAESILEDLPTPMLGMTRDGTLQFVNKACEEACALHRADLLGKHIAGRVLPPLEWGRFRAALPPEGAYDP